LSINRENIKLELLSEFANKTTEESEKYLGNWEGLDESFVANSTFYPSFAWFVPDSAESDDYLYAGIRVID
jgi:hypothetical protein